MRKYLSVLLLAALTAFSGSASAARIYLNNVTTKLTAAASAAATSITVTAGDGAQFAAATGSDWIVATLVRVSGFKETAWEIVKITARSTDTLTIVRAQEGTTAITFAVGDKLEVRTTAGSFTSDVAITGGTINGTSIGATTRSSGAFTTLDANGNVVLGDASTDTLNVGNGGIVKDASGNTGFGTTSPDAKVDIEPTGAVAAASTGLKISNLTTNATTDGINKYGAYITSTGTWTGGAGAATNNYGLYVDTVSGGDNNYGAYLAQSVGIGTASPTESLDVNGNIRVPEGNAVRFGSDQAQIYASSTTQLYLGAASVALSGKIAMYNAIATEGYGVPAIVDLVSLTGQVADITATNFTNAGTAGLYRINYVLQDTTADAAAGILTLTISWTDGAGATTATATQTLATVGRSAGYVYLQLASGNATYAVTHTGIYGTAVYALYMTAERLN